jgi:MSHA biogenesis protein MshP
MKRHARSAGSALITAIFLIVVLAGLGLAVMNLSTVEHDTTSKSMLSARVYYGAKAGLDWGIQQAVATSWDCSSSGSFSLSQGAFGGVSVVVSCSRGIHGAGNLVWYITSRATLGSPGSLGYAERRMEATVSNIP